MPLSTRRPTPPARRRVRGFTLIEHIAALTLAGSVSATALPALMAIDQQARQTVLRNLAASAASAMVLNQAGCMVTEQRVVPGTCQAVRDCADVSRLLQADLPAGYVVPPQALAVLGSQGSHCSVLRLDDGSSASFNGMATGT